MSALDYVMVTPVDADGENRGLPVPKLVSELVASGAAAASTTTAGVVKQITFTAQQSPDFASLAAVTTAYNALLTKLIAAGIMPAA